MVTKMLITGMALLTAVYCTGCLFVSSGGQKVKIVRAEEPRQAVSFQTETSSAKFDQGYQRQLNRSTLSTEKSGSLVIPFICVIDNHSTTTKLAPNAVFNDCVTECDMDNDGVITEAEAEQFAKSNN